MKQVNESILILFKSILLAHADCGNAEDRIKEWNAITIPKGFIFSPKVINENMTNELKSIIKNIEKHLIIKGSQINNAFHKSWDKVANASDFQLRLEQIVHYMTTYGMEFLTGMYDSDQVFIPYEKLEIPELKEDIKLMYIKGITKEELKEKVVSLLSSGVALKQETIDMISDTFELFELTEKEISEIRNKEIKMVLYQKYNMVPKNPVAFLRYVIYEITGSTLIIKSRKVIEEIREKDLNDNKSNVRRIENLFKKYKDSYRLELLATIFNRYKPLFLATRKGYPVLKPVINRIRKLAIKNHQPMKEDYLNSITKYIKQGKNINSVDLAIRLDRASIFRKLRLMYALHYRSLQNGSIIYRIRNGSSFSTELDCPNSDSYKKVLQSVKESIVKDLSKSVKGKKILLPDFIDYALPSTEKQFTGNFPSGTKVTVPKDMIVGIHWEDQKKHRIDLDLSLNDISGTKYGWDGEYRDESRDILFSGDLTSAPLPNGSSELFYVKSLKEGVYMLVVNYYNYDAAIPVPFKIIVGQDDIQLFRKNYVIDPNKILATTSSTMTRRQKIIGTLFVSKSGCKFVFSEMDMGKGISFNTSHEYIKHAQKYLCDFYNESISMRDLLTEAGASITDSEKFEVEKKRIRSGEYIDLSPEALERDTILSLIAGNKHEK